MASKNAAQSTKRMNDFGADLWVRDQATRRQPTGGRGMFAGLQDAKHYHVEQGWAKREPDAQPGFFSWLYNRLLTAEREGSSWRQMRAWMMMKMAPAAARTKSETNFPSRAPVLEPVRLSLSAQSQSPMAALAMRMRQDAQRRTMATMASPSPSPLPFLGALSQATRHSHRSYLRPRRLPARIIIPQSPATRLNLKHPVPKILTKALPLTIISLALAAATASWVVAIVLHLPTSRLQLSSSSTSASVSADRLSPKQTTHTIPHQVYDEAMYNDPALGDLMEQNSSKGHGLGLGPFGCFFIRDAGEERRVLRDRYGYSFWVDGISGLDS